jgi:uncharacterized membrane protein YbhN (UPF0104 family)
MNEQKAKITKTFNYLIRALIILLTYWFIYSQVFKGHKVREIEDFLFGIWQEENSGLLLALILFMMLVNWGLESLKWKILIAKIEKVQFIRAFQAVLTGVSVSMFTPNRTGDYLGRVFILKKGNHIEGIFSTIVGSFAQIIVTYSIGLFCLLTFVDHYIRIPYRMNEYLFNSLILLIPCMVFMLLIIYFKIGILTDFIGRFIPSRWEKFRQYTGIFGKFNSNELLKVILLSLARYLIFTTQFYLLLRIFGAELPVMEGFILIPVIYLVMAMVPTVALTELGIRGSVSIYIIGLYFEKTHRTGSDTELVILAASTILWLINIILPAVMGTFFVFSLKFFRK